MLKSLILIIFLFGLTTLVASQTTVCTSFDKTTGCMCIPESLQIICENLPNLTADDLEKVGTSVNSDFDLLYIIKTNITEIKENSFNSAFVKIFVQNNTNLENVNKNAFKKLEKTTELVFKFNENLVGDLIGLISSTSFLQIVDFRGNKLTKVPDGAFNTAAKQQELQFISLDNQTSQGLEISSSAFGNLPKLRQLSLDNKVKLLADNSIDLTASLETTVRLDVYIEKSQLTTWNNNWLKVPAKPSPAIWLSLRGPVSIGDNIKSDQFTNFFSQPNNTLFVSSTANRVCDCTNVKSLLLLNENKVRVSGLQCKNADICVNS